MAFFRQELEWSRNGGRRTSISMIEPLVGLRFVTTIQLSMFSVP
jgi:hypothetical protein